MTGEEGRQNSWHPVGGFGAMAAANHSTVGRQPPTESDRPLS